MVPLAPPVFKLKVSLPASPVTLAVRVPPLKLRVSLSSLPDKPPVTVRLWPKLKLSLPIPPETLPVTTLPAAVVSNGEYGVPKGLVFGYPVTTEAGGKWKVVEGLKFDAFGQAAFKKTLDELIAEREAVKELMPD